MAEINHLKSSSCGFYITANNVDKRPSNDECGGLFCETMPFECSNEYAIAFSCTNTTYKDSNGNAEGITIFVTTNRTTNERLAPNQQDPRYVNQRVNPFSVYEALVTDLNFTSDLAKTEAENTPSESLSTNERYLTPDPDVFPTCARGCFCSYAPQLYTREFSIAVYTYCECLDVLPDIFLNLAGEDLAEGSYNTVFTTPTNFSLLDSYYISYDEFGKTIANLGGLWVNISEGDNLTLQTGFEYFGDAETISDVIANASGSNGFNLR